MADTHWSLWGHSQHHAPYVALCGMDVCKARIDALTESAKQHLAEGFADTSFLNALADSMAVRMN